MRMEAEGNVEKEKIAHLKDKLLEIRSDLLSGVSRIKDRSTNEEFMGEVPDLNDEASRTYNRQVLYCLSEVDRQQLKMVEEALLRIEDNDYGYCIDCEEEIPFRRLEAAPYVKRCVACKEKWEQEAR